MCSLHSSASLVPVSTHKKFLNAGGEEGRQMLSFITTLLYASEANPEAKNRERGTKKRAIFMPVEATLTDIVASEIKSNSQWTHLILTQSSTRATLLTLLFIPSSSYSTSRPAWRENVIAWMEGAWWVIMGQCRCPWKSCWVAIHTEVVRPTRTIFPRSPSSVCYKHSRSVPPSEVAFQLLSEAAGERSLTKAMT